MITNDYSRNEKDYVTHNDYVDSDERKGWESKINNNINSEETDDDNRDNNLDKIVALTAWNTEELMLYKVINITKLHRVIYWSGMMTLIPYLMVKVRFTDTLWGKTNAKLNAIITVSFSGGLETH